MFAGTLVIGSAELGAGKADPSRTANMKDAGDGARATKAALFVSGRSFARVCRYLYLGRAPSTRACALTRDDSRLKNSGAASGLR